MLRYTELAQKNLGAGRGRVRRIHVLTPDGNQLNVLCVSNADAECVALSLLRRWARQENQFKYGVERLKLNQLDGRGIHVVPVDEEIPNPARRRLDLVVTIARQQEGAARRGASSLPSNRPMRATPSGKRSCSASARCRPNS